MIIDDGMPAHEHIVDISLESPLDITAGSRWEYDASGLFLNMREHLKWSHVDLPLAEITGPGRKKLKLEFNSPQNVRAIFLSYPPRTKVRQNTSYYRLIDIKREIAYFRLKPTKNRTFRLSFRAVKRGHPVKIRIKRITVEPRSAIDTKKFFFLFALGTASFFVVVGVAVGTLYRWKSVGELDYLLTAGLMVGVVVFFLTLYCVLLLTFQLDWLPSQSTVAAAAVVLLILLLGWHYYIDRLNHFRESFRQLMPHIGVYLVLVLVVTSIMIHGINMPLQEMFWSSISKYKTFRGHTAHDLGFQYLNGLAIAQDRAFVDYYKAPHLVRGLFYNVEDRQMLAGTLYAVYRSMIMAISQYVGSTYSVYAIFGSCLTMLVVFPIISFCQRYCSYKSTPLIVLALSANAYVLVNYYYTWFKLLAGGFVIAGILLLISGISNLRNWIGAGITWGIGVSFHAGAVMTLPFFGFYFFVKLLRKNTRRLLHLIWLPIILCVVFASVNLPWTIVKANHFPDNYKLFRQHFLSGEQFSGNIGNTIANFFSSNAAERQIQQRFSQLSEAARFQEVQDTIDRAKTEGMKSFMFSWSRYEYRYIAILLYPYVIFILIAWMVAKISRKPPDENITQDQFKSERAMVFSLASISIVVTMFSMFTKSQTDSTSLISAAGLLIVYLLATNVLYSLRPIGKYLLVSYLAFSSIRLAISYYV